MPAQTAKDMVPTFEAAFNSGDIEQVIALYEPDYVLVPQAGQTVAGTAAIRKALLGFLAMRGQIKLASKRVPWNGDIAFVSSHWDLNGTGPDGSAVSMSSDTSEVIRKQSDGTWRYAIDDPFSLP